MQKPFHTIQEKHKTRKLIIFDLDGTLAESKADIDTEMASLLTKLLARKKVAVIGGGQYALFQRQLLSKLGSASAVLKNLFLFPTTSTAFYRLEGKDWKMVYSKTLGEREKHKIHQAFQEVFAALKYKHPKKIHGDLIEDRGSQVTFSALGQEAPLDLKEEWKKKHTDLKLKIAKALQKKLPNFEVRAAGFTSIDVTKKGIDKEYGIKQIRKYLKVPFGQMLFVGDALFPGGNDSAALRTSVPCIHVNGPEDTKKIIKALIGQ